MTNNEIGNAWMLHVFGQLSEAWPHGVDLSSDDLVTATGVGPDNEDAVTEMFDNLLAWLRDEGLVRFTQSTEGAAYDVQLTVKAMDLIGHTMPTDNGPAGAQLKTIAADVGTTAGRAAIAETVGQLIGAAARTFAGGS